MSAEKRGAPWWAVSVLAGVIAFVPGSSFSAADAALANQVVFNPGTVSLTNPVNPKRQGVQQQVALALAVYDQSGNPVQPSPGQPVEIRVYGAPEGVITPSSMQVTDGGGVTISYSGGYIPNPVTLEAYLKLSGSPDSYAIGTIQILPKNPVAGMGAKSFSVPYWCDTHADPNCGQSYVQSPLKVLAAVGVASPGADQLSAYTIDTGSLGVVVPVGELGANAIGPAGPGVKFYNSSGNTYSGNYYLAPVTIAASAGGGSTQVQTFPIMVLAIDKAYCAPGYKKCDSHPPTPDLHYLGVGFDRNGTGAGDSFNSPAYNAFLQIDTAANGADVNPGYVLTGTGIGIGISTGDIKGFSAVKLTPSAEVPGDWNAAPGCYAFPGIGSVPNRFCGSLLMDVGTPEMFLELNPDRRPSKAVKPSSSGHGYTVPAGTVMSVLAGSPGHAAMKYKFSYEPEEPRGPAPSSVTWVDPPAPQSVFANTGRNFLNSFDYLYDARHGKVGFKPAQ
ncbi:MAG: hypothetical protein PHT19_15550 [Methylococcus sp.]|nr:hypothetical protein [Methylococcus sp.]